MRETQYLYFFIVYSYFIVKYFLTGRDRKEAKTWEREPLIITEHIPALIYRYLSCRCRYFFPILSTVLLFDLSESRHRPTSHFRHMNFRDWDLDVEVRKYAVVGPGAVFRRDTIGALAGSQGQHFYLVTLESKTACAAVQLQHKAQLNKLIHINISKRKLTVCPIAERGSLSIFYYLLWILTYDCWAFLMLGMMLMVLFLSSRCSLTFANNTRPSL